MEKTVIFNDDRAYLAVNKIRGGSEITLCLTWLPERERRIQKLAMDKGDAIKFASAILDSVK
jgi:hypothetical protein